MPLGDNVLSEIFCNRVLSSEVNESKSENSETSKNVN